MQKASISRHGGIEIAFCDVDRRFAPRFEVGVLSPSAGVARFEVAQSGIEIAVGNRSIDIGGMARSGIARRGLGDFDDIGVEIVGVPSG